MNRSRRLSGGAAWNYAAQLATAAAQFAYAALAARAVGDDGFGAYAIALSVSGLAGMVANGGLVQSVGRMHDVSISRLAPLMTYALISGGAVSLFLLTTADLWGLIWSSPAAAEPIRLFAISAFFAPFGSLAAGIALRLGRFKSFAVNSLLANLGGMLVGGAVLLTFSSAPLLTVAPIVTSFLVFLLNNAALRFRYLRFGRVGHALADLNYSWTVTGSNLLSYFSNSVSRWGVTTGVGAGALGQWNRAEAVSTVPMYNVQTAIMQVVFPEFRNDVENPERARRIWPDLLELVGWVTVPIGAVLAVVLPSLIPVLFGPGWEQASEIAPILGVAAAVQPLIGVINNAVLAIGKRSWVLGTELSVLTTQVLIAVAVLVTHDLRVAIWGVLIAGAVQHAWQVVLCVRNGYLGGASVLRRYLGLLLLGVTVFAVVTIGVDVAQVQFASPIFWGCAVGLIIVALLLVWKGRRYLPPWRIAVRYGLIRER